MSFSGSAAAVALACCLSACSSSLPGATPAPGFVNQTRHTDNDLWAIWDIAQQNVSRQVDLNPLQRKMYNAAPDIHPGDARALTTQPLHLKVAAEQDVSSDQLLAQAGALALIRPA